MERVLAGHPSKNIAADFGVSQRKRTAVLRIFPPPWVGAIAAAAHNSAERLVKITRGRSERERFSHPAAVLTFNRAADRLRRLPLAAA
jgi:hypothetical protein